LLESPHYDPLYVFAVLRKRILKALKNMTLSRQAVWSGYATRIP